MAQRRVPMARSDSKLIELEFGNIRDKFEEEVSKMEAEMSRFRAQLAEAQSAGPPAGACPAGEEASAPTGAAPTAAAATAMPAPGQAGAASAAAAAAAMAATNTSSSSSSSASTSSSSSASSSRTTTTCSTRTSTSSYKRSLVATKGGHQPANSWLSGLASSPLVVDDEERPGDKLIRLRFDVADYAPDDVQVLTLGDNRLQVSARALSVNSGAGAKPGASPEPADETGAATRLVREYRREFVLPDGVDLTLIRSSLSADGVLTVDAPLAADRM